jgi:ubiquinone/menaquinone biosynthesis C-methylase UbiE
MISKENMILVYLENPPGPEGSNGIQNCGCWRGADWKRSRGNLSGHLARLEPVRLIMTYNFNKTSRTSWANFLEKSCINIIILTCGYFVRWFIILCSLKMSMDEDAAKFHLLSEERYKYQDADKIVSGIGDLKGSILEIGCGPGFFTLPLVKLQNGVGTYQAIDSSPEMIRMLKERLLTLDQTIARTVRTVVGDAERIYFPERSFDLVFLANIFHDLKDPKGFLVRMYRVLKPGGFIVNIDWSNVQSEIGPPMNIRIPEEKCKAMFIDAHFRFVGNLYGGEYHYGLKFTRL